MATPYLGEIKMVSFDFPPKNWASCDGATLAISQNQALFSLLGVNYGGDGANVFQLPNMRGRMPMGYRSGANQMGQTRGEENHTLTQSEMPQHVHLVQATTHAGTQVSPAGNYVAAHRGGFSEAPQTLLVPGTLTNTGGSQPHPNMPPYLTINFVIALVGAFPPRN